jgi:pimeloyl-ACP methyl ester carboxylesterase
MLRSRQVCSGGRIREPIEFVSDDKLIRGHLYRAVSPDPQPVVVMSHGWGATAAMGLVPYAEAFAGAGYATLLYDNPNFGISDGEPRQEIDPWSRTRAMRNAVSLVESIHGLDSERIAIWGDSGDAERVFLDAATDQRVKAIISYNPTFGAESPEAAPSEDVFAKIARVVEAERLPGEAAMRHGPEPIVAPDPTVECMSPSPQAFRWFIDYGGRHGSGWLNQWSYAISDVGVPHSPYDCLPQVDVPALVVAGRDDEISVCVPSVQQTALSLTNGSQFWHQIDGGHFGALYHPSPVADEMTRIQLDFLAENL